MPAHARMHAFGGLPRWPAALNVQCIIRAMVLKIVLLVWFIALFLSLVAKKGSGRTWMARLFIGGLCLLLLGFFLKLISRVL